MRDFAGCRLGKELGKFQGTCLPWNWGFALINPTSGNELCPATTFLWTAMHCQFRAVRSNCTVEPASCKMINVETIAIAGFKSFGAEVRVSLRPVNLLIGANGSGKSNFLNAFAFLQAFGSGHMDDFVIREGGAERILHFGSRNSEKMTMTTTFGGGDGYELHFRYAEPDRVMYVDPFPPGREDEGSRRLNRFGSWRCHHFLDTGFHSPMKMTCKVDDNRFLRHDGSNLASLLYLLKQKHKRSYRDIQDAVRLVVPFFEDFLLEPFQLGPDTTRLRWRHRSSDEHFDASSLSGGTLRYIALATLLLQPKELQPTVVVLDEPELGLHPFAIAALASMLRVASHRTQIVLATQSPVLLDHFDPEDVLIAERKDGQSRITRLEAEKLRRWLEDYSLGQLWNKNELGGRPAPENGRLQNEGKVACPGGGSN